MINRQKELGQYPTPAWISEALVERHFSDLDRHDLVLEPSCGPGSFLAAIPDHVPAVGVEIDAVLADQARRNTGREIITGDFLTTTLRFSPTCIIGNPPFDSALIKRFLDRAHRLLPEGGRVGFILPSYVLQAASTVSKMADHWSMQQEMIPRSIYPGLSKPLNFVIFSKDARRLLIGFALYRETADLQQMDRQWQKDVAHSTMPVWEGAVARAMEILGGQATLQQLYSYLERNRPTRACHWREKVRQTVRRYSGTFVAEGGGTYRLARTILVGTGQLAHA